MKKFLGITFGGLHSKILAVLLIFLLAIVGFNTAVSVYKTSTLSEIVDESGKEQREAIEKVSGDTMYKTVENSLTTTNTLRAEKLDDEFTEIENNVLMLQDLAKNFFEKADELEPASVPLPDPDNEDELEVHLLFEEGVDYSRSEYVGIAGHMVDTMVSLVETDDMMDSCYIGLADGTHIGVGCGGADKYDENGKQKPYPVRHRPWYVSALEKGDLVFTGVERDAFNGSLSVTCAAPVIVNGRTVAVIGTDITIENMDEFVDEANNEAEFIFVLNNDGRIVAVPENNGIFTLDESDNAEDLRTSDNKELAGFITRALKEPTGLETVTLNGKEYYLSSAPMKTIGWAVVSVVDKEMTKSATNNLLSEINRINTGSADTFKKGMSKLSMLSYIIVVLIIIIGSISALLVANRIVKPITAMTDNITGKNGGNGTFEMKGAHYLVEATQVGGALTVENLTFSVRGFDGNSAVFSLPRAQAGAAVITEALPVSFTFPLDKQGRKFAIPSGQFLKYQPARGDVRAAAILRQTEVAGSRRLKMYELVGLGDSNPNKSKLKLSYAHKTGLFKGSFYVYTTTGYNYINNGGTREVGKPKLTKMSVKVVGIVMAGRGFGMATLKSTGQEWFAGLNP